MYTQPLFRFLCKGPVGVVFRIRTNNAEVSELYTVRSLMFAGACCAHVSTASKVSSGWMRYASGTTLSKKTLSILGSMVSDGLCRRHGAARA